VPLPLGALLLAAAGAEADVVALERAWSGVRDSSEQVVMSAAPSGWPNTPEQRVRTVVSPVSVAWLGAHLLYLEEFLEDDPEHPRRQLLMQLEPAGEGTHAVHVHLFTFSDPHQWLHLGYRPHLAAALVWRDVVSSAGCDLTLTRAGDQFRGGTLGDQCRETGGAGPRYLDYQLVLSSDLYWYRRRSYRGPDAQLQQEVIGFDRFEANEARLYACRVGYSPSGAARDLKPLATLDLYEAGGHGRFTTPDGRAFLITLHGRDWPFAVERDALLLSLQEEGHEAPLATAWAQMDAQQIALSLEGLEVRCGAIAAESDELSQ
jgi:hypothetical protein